MHELRLRYSIFKECAEYVRCSQFKTSTQIFRSVNWIAHDELHKKNTLRILKNNVMKKVHDAAIPNIRDEKTQNSDLRNIVF